MIDAVAIAGVRRTARELVDGTIRVQVDIEPRFRAQFFKLFPEVDMHIALAPFSNATTTPSGIPAAGAPDGERAQAPQAAGNQLARHMHVAGYFRNPKLWRALHDHGAYTAQEHKHYIESLPCCGGGYSPHRCDGQVCLHHCASAALPAAGPKLQPENPNKVPHWYGVPVCHEFHRNFVHAAGATRETHAQLLVLAVALTEKRMKHVFKMLVGVESLSAITLEKLNEFEEQAGLPRTRFEADAAAR